MLARASILSHMGPGEAVDPEFLGVLQAGGQHSVGRSRAAHPQAGVSPSLKSASLTGFSPWASMGSQTPLPSVPSSDPTALAFEVTVAGPASQLRPERESWALAIFRAKIEAHGLFAQHLN